MPYVEAGQWIDSPSGRIARAQEIDAAWQQLWQADYSSHADDQVRAAFDEDYKTWQVVKEKIAAMGIVSIMAPPTGDLLERWHVRALDWFNRFKELGVTMAAPSPKTTPPIWESLLPQKRSLEGPTQLVWALVGLVASGVAMLVVTKWAGKHAGGSGAAA